MKKDRKNGNASRLIWGILFFIFISILIYYAVVYQPSHKTTVTDLKQNTHVSFGWWGNDDRHLYTLKGVDMFEQKYPGIDVNCTYSVWNGYERRNRVYMLSGNEPDVMQINFNWLQEYSADGKGYYDLNKLTDFLDLSAYTDKDLAYGTSNGVLNAIPIAYNAVVFYYNEDLLEQYGLSIPQTWDDLFHAAEVMQQDDRYPLMMSEKHTFLAVAAHYEQTTGQTLFNADGTYTGGTEAAGELLTFYKQLYDAQVIGINGKSTNTDFSNGTAAGVAIWASDAENYCQQLEDNEDTPVLADPPRSSDSESRYGWYVKPATMYAISKNTEHPKESAELLNFLINNRQMILLQGTEKGIPVSSRARQTLSVNGRLNGYDAEAGNFVLSNLDTFETMVPSLENSDVIDAFQDQATQYAYGVADLDTCAQALSDSWTATLAQQDTD